MGGLDLGEEASRVAVKVFMREYLNRKKEDSVSEALWRALKIANIAVFDLAFDGEGEKDLGTTLVAAVIRQGMLHWVSAGDSRIYLYRNKKLNQLTRDHIYGNHLQLDVANGIISQKEADNHPERSHLTSYLGLPELPETDMSVDPLPLQQGDVVVLSTDGLFDTLSEKELTLILGKKTPDPAKELVKCTLAKKYRHQDNVTVVTFTVNEA